MPPATRSCRRRYALSEIQAQEILNMRLQRLTGLERQKIIDEAREVEAAIARYRLILADEAQVRALIAQELTELKERFGDGRRTEIVPEAQEFTAEDLIADEEMVVTISHRSYIKRTPLTIYRSQRRGGKGRTGMATRENDFVSQLYIASTHSYFLVFSNKGRVFWLRVHEIPVGSPTRPGQGHRQPGAVGAGRKSHHHSAGQGVRPRALPGDGHPPGRGEEDRPDELPAAPERRPHRPVPGRRRRTGGRRPERTRAVHPHGHPPGQDHPLPRRRGPGHGPRRPGSEGHGRGPGGRSGGHGGAAAPRGPSSR